MRPHQLRNPIAAIQSLAEVAQDAPNLAEVQSSEITSWLTLAGYGQASTRLTEQLLSYERLLRNRPARKSDHPFDPFVAEILSAVANKVVDADVELSFSVNAATLLIKD